MATLPVPLVFRELPPRALVDALEGAALSFRACTLADAAQSVNDGWADVVICERLPGWQALAGRVHCASGALVLLGSPPEPFELRQLSRGVVTASSPVEAVRLVRQAQSEVALRRAHVSSPDRISQLAQSIALQLDLPGLTEEAAARTRDLCDADGASLFLVDPDTGVFSSAATALAKKVASTAEAMLVADVPGSAWAEAEDPLAGFTTGSAIAAPVVMAGDLLGVLLALRGGRRAAFTADHLRQLTALAPHVGIAVHNATLAARLKAAQGEVVRQNAELEHRITQRTRQIARAKREWEATFDAIGEPIAVQDGFVVRRANLAWAALAGVPITDVVGRTCHHLIAGRDSPCAGCPLLRDEKKGELFLGGGRTVEAAAFRLPDENDGWVVHYQDVTRQRVLERRVRQSERLASVGQLAAGAAHEINNPLAFLMSNLRSLRELLDEVAPAIVPDLATEAADMISESLDGAQRVAEIVRALRELSLQQVSERSVADVDVAVARAVHSELDGHSARVDVRLGAAGWAAVDPLQLDQALRQLLRNARQATGPGQKVTVRTRRAEGDILIAVEDEGAGIAPEHQRRVYDPFFTTRGVGKGVGLGLAATWAIVERHRGSIELSSELGRGTTFIVRLPGA